MPFLLAEILNFQGSTHHIGVGSFSKLFYEIKKDLFQIEKEGFTDALKSLISL